MLTFGPTEPDSLPADPPAAGGPAGEAGEDEAAAGPAPEPVGMTLLPARQVPIHIPALLRLQPNLVGV